jgi:hypothetical protein
MPKVRVFDALEVDAIAAAESTRPCGRLRDFLGSPYEIGPRFRVTLALIQYLGNDFRVGFLDMLQPCPDA